MDTGSCTDKIYSLIISSGKHLLYAFFTRQPAPLWIHTAGSILIPSRLFVYP